MPNHLRSFVRHSETGQTNIEYGMVVTLIGVAAITVLMLVGGDITADFNEIRDKLLAVL